MAATDEKADVAMVASAADGSNEATVQAPEKKKRGKPKDPDAPPKPKNAFQQVTGEVRRKLKEEDSPICKDLAKMGAALKEAWEKTPEAEKERLTAQYNAEMEIWKPKWEAYKQTPHYKEFFELKQDYIDGRQRKKLVKTLNKDAPKRPRSGYMIFGGEIRERVQKEVMEAGGGMGDIGKKISEEWNNLSEGKKAEYGEQSQRLKEKYDIEFAEYKKSEAFGKFAEEKVKLEAKQTLKKLVRTKLDEMPKKSPSSFGLFRKEAGPAISEANKGLSMGELGKKLAAEWAKVPQEKKDEYQKEADRLKEEYDKKVAAFKGKEQYSKFLEERAKVRSRENRLVNLREMPKKPKTVFALFADDHKTEVPAGKGEGKGRSALKAKFAECPLDKKADYEKKEKELKEQWEKDMEAFKASEKFQGYCKNTNRIKMELMNEASKVMTLRFLNDAPPVPPKSAFSVFLSEKRKGAGSSAKGDKKAEKEEVAKYKGDFEKLDKDTKLEYENQRKGKLKEWQDKVKEYMASEKWQEYVKEAKRLKVPVKSLLSQKSKAIRKLKNGLTVLPMPERPDDFPTKPPAPYRLFANEKRGQVESIAEIAPMWEKLNADERKKYNDQAAVLQKRYDEEMKVFRASDAGKNYFRQSMMVGKRNRIAKAKIDFLKDMPRKPKGALELFYAQNLKDVKKANPELKEFELKKRLTEKWQALEEEQRTKLEEETKVRMDAFQEALKSFKDSENWQKYVRAVRGAMMIKPPSKPEGMPQKPPDALKAYCKEHAGEGKSVGDLIKAFNELSEEEKASLSARVAEEQNKFKEDLKEFDKSAAAMKYKRDLLAHARRKNMLAAQSRCLKGEPKKPPNAQGIFDNERKAEVQQQNPDLKGSGLQAKLAELWKGLSDEDRKVWEDKAAAQKEDYDKKLEEFHNSDSYKRFKALESGKAKVLSVGPPPMRPATYPEKPLDAFKAFCKDHAGQGKTKAELDTMFKELSPEDKQERMKMASEAMSSYNDELAEFNKSDVGRKYRKDLIVYEKRKKIIEAKNKYLKDEPRKPPTAQAIFFTEKRPQVVKDFPDLKGLGPVQTKLAEMWKNLGEEDKKQYEEKAKARLDEYDEQMDKFKETPEYKKYNAALNASSTSKPSAKVKAVASAGPPKPDSLPKKPASAMLLFLAEFKGSGGSVGAAPAAWRELGAEGQEKYNSMAKEKQDEYENAMREFTKSAEGKKYFREKAAAEKKNKLKAAKARFLDGNDGPTEPKRPLSAYFLFIKEKRPTLTSATKAVDAAKELTKMWGEVTPEEKKIFEDKAAEMKKVYEEEMAAYKNSEHFKKYDAVVKSVEKSGKRPPTGASGRGRGAAKSARGAGRGSTRSSPAAAGKDDDNKDDDNSSDVMGSESNSSDSDSSDSD